MRLSDLKSGETAVIVKVLGHGAFRKRVMEMGFVKGRKIKAILSAPLKDPVKYSLMGYEVSLRRSEAEMIEVVPIEADYDNSADIPKVNVGESEDYDSVHRERYEGERRTVNVALIGNPNCGKTSLFNVACGWHAGDPIVMEKTISLAKEFSTAVGAHPGFPDLMGFGRRNMAVTPEEARAYVKYQLGALMAFTQSKGMKIQHVKPHGAIYNMAAVDEQLARAMCEAVYEVDKNIIFMGLAGSKMISAAEKVGLRAASEVFADRAYNDDGTLVSRKLPGAVIKDKEVAIKRVVRMVKEGKVESINGNDIAIRADSICVHGDNPKALEFVKNIRETLIAEGISIRNLMA